MPSFDRPIRFLSREQAIKERDYWIARRAANRLETIFRLNDEHFVRLIAACEQRIQELDNERPR